MLGVLLHIWWMLRWFKCHKRKLLFHLLSRLAVGAGHLYSLEVPSCARYLRVKVLILHSVALFPGITVLITHIRNSSNMSLLGFKVIEIFKYSNIKFECLFEYLFKYHLIGIFKSRRKAYSGLFIIYWFFLFLHVNGVTFTKPEVIWNLNFEIDNT